MSIYATYGELAVPIFVPCDGSEGEWTTVGPTDDPSRYVRERWIQVVIQSVPAHIGYEGGEEYYGTFLPPRVEYDENDWNRCWTPRAVLFIDEDHREKDGQRYINPLLMLTGAEYEAATFSDLFSRITDALEQRFGDPPTSEAAEVRQRATRALAGGQVE